MIPKLLLMLAGAAMLQPAPRILVHGGQGAAAFRPANTLPSFEYAINAGADALELDLVVTKDNVVVVSHDPTLAPPYCTGPRPGAVIRELTLSQLRAWDCGAIRDPSFPRQTPVPGTRMPTLDEVFSLASRGSFDFNIETKIYPGKEHMSPAPEEFARLALEQIRKHKLEKRVILQSFDFRTLHAMRKLAPEIRLSALHWKTPKDFVAIAREAGAQIVSPHFKLVTPEQVRAAHAAGLQVIPWTPNLPEEWDQMIAAEVDAIISDDPAGLIARLKKRGLR
ncbi:MAG: glycerophosphodiester phosphodiesterase family protein [Blastocatellia bacterium]